LSGIATTSRLTARAIDRVLAKQGGSFRSRPGRESLTPILIGSTVAVALFLGSGCARAQASFVSAAIAEVGAAEEGVPSGAEDARLTPASRSVPAGAYFGAAVLVADRELSPIGRVVEVVGPTVIPRRTPPQIHPYDRVYVTLTRPTRVGDRLHLMRPAAPVPLYGRIHVATGTGVVVGVSGSVATVEVDGFYDRVAIGDLALPMPAYAERAGVVPVPAGGLDGRVLAMVHPQPIVATEDQAFVDLGAASGVVEGDEFEVYLPGTRAPWGERPEVVVARLQVVRAGRLTSAVRVLALQYPALEAGLPVRLVARMP
jgi:hypothetical protein